MYIIILLIIFQLQSSSPTRKILKMKLASFGDRNFQILKTKNLRVERRSFNY